MTVAIPETVTRARARQSKPTPEQMGAPRARQGRQGQQGRQGKQGKQGRPQGRQRPAPKQSGGKTRKGPRADVRRLTGAATSPGPALHNYQAIIAAEFVGAILLVAISPIATRQAQVSPTSGKLSPYVPGDLIKLWAIGMVYLILEGLAAGPRSLARFAAWFGFLIFIGVGLSELARIGKIFATLAGAEVSPIQLVGAQAPVSKGDADIPPVGQGGGVNSPPPPKTGA